MPEQEVGLRLSLKERRETAAGLRDTEQGLDRVGRSAETSGKRARLGAKGFAILGKAAKVGFLGIAGAATAAVAASVGFVKSAAEDQKSARKMAVTLRATTGARRRDIKSIENWITAQGKALGVADDDLRPAISTLATATGSLTKARKLTTLANNIAVGKDKSLASVATALGKAYTGNVAGLARLGVKTKDAAGNTLTFDQVQRKLARTFNGQAAAAANTVAGKYDRFKLALSETGEAIGYQLLPYANRLGNWLTDKGIPLVGRWGDKIGTVVIPAIERFVRKIRPLANEVLPAVSDGLGTLRDVAGDIEGPLTRVFKAFNNLPSWAKSAIAIGAGGAVVAKKVGALSLGGKVASTALGAVKSAKPIPVFVTNPGGVGGIGAAAGGAGGVSSAAGAAGAGASAGRLAGLSAGALGLAGKIGGGALAIGGIFEGSDNKKINENMAAENKAALAKYAASISRSTAATMSAAYARAGQAAAVSPGIGTRKALGPILGPRLKEAQNYGAKLDGIARTKVNPKINPIGFPTAEQNTASLRGALDGINKPFTATVNANTAPAAAAVNSLLAKLGPVFSIGASVAAPAAPAAATPAKSGRTMPRTAKAPRIAAPEVAPRMASDGSPITVQLMMPSGQMFTELTLDGIEAKRARQ